MEPLSCCYGEGLADYCLFRFPHCAKMDCLTSDDGLIKAEFLPARTTSILQPMDQRVLYSVKAKYKKRLALELLNMEGDDIDKNLDR